jgi:ribosome-associated translation inhibitor RaiA
MKYSDQSYNLRINLDTENCELTPSQIEHVEEALSPLRGPVEDFPHADLYITIEFKPPSLDYRVKAVLRLPGRGLATGDVDKDLYPAFHRCVDKLVHKVAAYKEQLSDADDIAKHEQGTRHDIIAGQIVDGGALQEAVEQGDYPQFRRLTFPYEESLRKRIGRWIQRYPRIEAQLGSRFDLADVVEEVFLNAFQRFDEHPREVPFGDWLEDLIDPSLKLINEHGDEELANISFARTAMEADLKQRQNSNQSNAE